jgi:hypothetical protein
VNKDSSLITVQSFFSSSWMWSNCQWHMLIITVSNMYMHLMMTDGHDFLTGDYVFLALWTSYRWDTTSGTQWFTCPLLNGCICHFTVNTIKQFFHIMRFLNFCNNMKQSDKTDKNYDADFKK